MRRKKALSTEVDPGETLLDAKNIQAFDTQQFEGVIERPIGKRAVLACAVIGIVIGAALVGRFIHLQIAQGEAFYLRSENNRLHHIPVFGERGIIYDRNGVELAWNVETEEENEYPERIYREDPGFSHILGYIGYPTKDKSGFYWRTEYEAKSGLEKIYEDILQPENGIRLVETDAHFNITSENSIRPPLPGQNLTLSIDARIQKELHKYVRDSVEGSRYDGGVGIVMDVETGELIALTNYPEFDSNAMTSGDNEIIEETLNDSRKPFLNRAVSGLYTPGSTIKPYIALGALTEGVVTPETTIVSTGSIEIPNPYNPEQPSIFRDWRPKGHGTTDIYHAIADSVNTYFYSITGGYKHIDGIGIANIEKYMHLFGFDEITGVDLESEAESTIPTPQWKEETFDGDPWRLGDTFNSSIGQFGFQLTPMQIIRAMGGIATEGTLVTPYIAKNSSKSIRRSETITEIPLEHFETLHRAMRQTVTKGTAYSLNVPYVDIAAKTGTAQVGAQNKFTNSWSTGFFPFEHPTYAFVVVLERGPREGAVNATSVMRKLFDYMQTETPEYFTTVDDKSDSR